MRKKKIIILGMAVLLGTASLDACHTADKQTQEETQETQENSESQTAGEIHIVTDNSTEAAETEAKNEDSTEASDADLSAKLFAELSNWNFEFSSGAGAWSTELKIEADGSFSGSYHDSDMGTTGEGYPDGTVYLCNFTGKFAPVQKVNDYTYKTKLEKLETKEKDGKEELADGMRFVYSTPYGLADAQDIYIYVKGAPADKLPQEYQDWVMFPLDGAKTLPFYGLYNEKEQLGFYSWDASDLDDTGSGITADISPENGADSSADSGTAGTDSTKTGVDTMDGLMDTLNKTAKLEERLQKENLTQEEMNELSDELYKAWDAQLNTTWKQMKRTLDAETMEKITKEQREWLKERDIMIQEAGKGYEGGSIQSMLMSTEGAELTRERVYDLFEYLR